MDEIPPTLRAFRQGRGLRQVDIARMFGVSQQRIGVIERSPVQRLMIGTLGDYVTAAGGRLLIGAEVAGDVVVPLYWRPEREVPGWER